MIPVALMFLRANYLASEPAHYRGLGYTIVMHKLMELLVMCLAHAKSEMYCIQKLEQQVLIGRKPHEQGDWWWRCRTS